MKRKLFFWLDRLQISRNERIAVSALMALMLMLISALTFVDFTPAPDKERYAKLEKVFRERSQVGQQEHDAIMARYLPAAESPDPEAAGSRPFLDEEADTATVILETQEHEYALNDSIRININEATAEELQQLPGIGPAYSRRILEWRNENGNFTSADQLLEIRGIGPVRLEKIRSLIVL